MNGRVMGEAYHLANAIRILYPPEALTWHPWLDDHINIWCDGNFFTVWGPAASGKSNDFGLIALVDWFAAPEETCTFVCSTGKKELERRIWESITRYFNYAKQNYNVPGKVSKQRTAIINAQDRDLGDEVKAGITGVAVRQGTVEDAQSALIGAHLPYVRLLIDEMQATRRAAVEARKNLSKGCINFKFGGLGNPMSFLDLLGEFSEPVDGWESINVETPQWETRYGRCYHFDGFKSPAITDPDGIEKYPFLINRPQIDRDIKDAGGLEDHPEIWTMCRGFVPPEGIANTILTRNMIRHGCAMEPAIWQYSTTTVAGLDPAYSSNGDKCILAIAKVGKLVKTGRIAIEFMPHIEILIAASDGRTASEQVADQVIEHCKNYGVPAKYLGVDESGTQSTGDFIEMKGFKGVHRINFGSAPTNLPVSRFNPKPSHEEYRDRVAELWFSMRQFVTFGQIRALDPSSAIEFCERLAIPAAKKAVEKKEDMIERLNHSPDDADADAVLLDVVRSVMGIYPGDTETDPGIFGFAVNRPRARDFGETEEQAYQNVPEFDERMYTQAPV